MQRGERDALNRGCVLGGGAFVEVGDEVPHAGSGRRPDQVDGELHERVEGFPLLADRASPERRLGRPPDRREHVADGDGQ